MDIAVARILLPQLHIAFHTFGLPLHSHLLRIHGPGLEKTRSCQRPVARHQKNLPLSPVGRQRIRPCAVGTGPYPDIPFTPRRIAAAPVGHCGAPRRPCGLVNCAVGTGPYRHSFYPQPHSGGPAQKTVQPRKNRGCTVLIRWLFTGNYNSLYCSTTFIT